MKLHVLSDLHLEFSSFVPPATDADVVVLAGDIDIGTKGLDWARATFPDQVILYVAGNHEFYTRDSWRRLNPTLQERASALDIHFLENTAVELAGVRFLGATLWTDFDLFGTNRRAEVMEWCELHLSDYQKIRMDAKGGRASRLRTPSVRSRHQASVEWLQAQLDIGFNGPTVVVTHHLPSARCLPEAERADLVSAAYASNLESLMGTAKLWLHGHTHGSVDLAIGGTCVLANPRGYVQTSDHGERPGFAPGLVIEI